MSKSFSLLASAALIGAVALPAAPAFAHHAPGHNTEAVGQYEFVPGPRASLRIKAKPLFGSAQADHATASGNASAARSGPQHGAPGSAAH